MESLLEVVEPGDLVVGKSTVPVGTAARLAERSREVSPGARWSGTRSSSARASRSRTPCTPTGSSTGSRRRPTATRPRACSTRSTRRSWRSGTPQVVTDLRHRRDGEGGGQLVPGHQDLLHQRHGRAVRGHRRRREALADAIGYDDRIGRKFLNAGLGFGGGCLPKDIRAFMARAGELGADQALTFLREVDAINMRRRVRMVDLAREVCGGSIVGRRVAVLGAAFKPDSDDIRDSPALSVAAQMQLQGAIVLVTDPRPSTTRGEVAGARLRRDRAGGRSAPTWCWCSPSGRSTSPWTPPRPRGS